MTIQLKPPQQYFLTVLFIFEYFYEMKFGINLEF